jgi:hypothetical protein
MQNDNLKNENPTDANNVLVAGLVRVLKTPISERYCRVGDEATLDVKNKQIRCGGAWFNFDERWSVQPCH